MTPSPPACSFIHTSMAGSRSTAPLNRSKSVLIVTPLSGFEVCVYITEGLPVTRKRLPGTSPNPQMFAQDCSQEELRAICDGLFIPQRHDGIDAHGAARGQVSSNQTDRDHY